MTASDPAFPWRLVTVDIDGTLTVGHGWRPIARAFGRTADYDRTNRRFRSGEVGEDEHLRELLDLATGRTIAEVEAVIAASPHLEGIAEGVGELRRRGARTALLSHNPRYVVDYYRRTYGFEDAEGVPDPPVADGRLLAPGPVRADKRSGLAALIERAGVPWRRVVHIGDSRADAALFPLIGGGIALNSELPDVNRAADLALTSRAFPEVVARLAALAPRA